MMNNGNEDQWRELARRTVRRVNVGWVLEYARLPLLLVAFLLAVLVLRMRYLSGDVEWVTVGACAGGLITFSLLLSLWKSRGRFECEVDGLVRLETEMSLNNRLSAARMGVGSWPDFRKPEGMRWRLMRMGLPVIGGACLLVSAAYVPVAERAKDVYDVAPPKGFTDLVDSLEELELDEVVDEEYLEDMEEKVEQLSEANSEDWFSHSSLEAIDSLREAHKNNAAQLEQDLRSSEHALKELSAKDGKVSQEKKQQMLNDFSKAMESMDSGAMKPNKALMDQLKKMDPKMLNQVPKEQLDEMRKRMREHAERLKKQQRENGDDIGEEPGQVDGDGQGEGEEGSDGDGDKRGKGGVDRGPGHPPGVLGDEVQPLEGGKYEGIDPKNLDGALPGDLLDTRETEHDVDKSATGKSAGGEVKGKSKGGDRVWQNELLPAEQKALKKFFK